MLAIKKATINQIHEIVAIHRQKPVSIDDKSNQHGCFNNLYLCVLDIYLSFVGFIEDNNLEEN
jgi:hypothetical protein